jgi:hypothetical protein
MNKNTILLALSVIMFGLMLACKKNTNSPIPPLTPTDLNATVISTTQVNLTWVDKSTNETGFKLERKTPNSQYAVIATLGVNATSFSDVGLTSGATYTYRVYSYNEAGNSPSYSNEVTVTLIGLATLTTTDIQNITATDATTGGNITNDGGGTISSRGVVWSTSTNPTISLSTKTTDGSGSGLFGSSISGLSANTKYYVRAYATNAAGTAYGNEISFSTNSINIKNGLIAFFPFSGNAGDSSGNNNHGTVNAATLTTDRFGNANRAYLFDGKTSNIYINNPFFDNGWSEYTVAFWFNLSQMSNPNNVNASNVPVNTSPHNGLGFSINWGQSGKYAVWKGTPNLGWTYLNGAQSNQAAVVNIWKHITIQKVQNQISLYIDGVLDKSYVLSGTIASYLCKMYLGSVEQPSPEVFNGKLDEFRFYKRALTTEEINYLSKN